MTANEILNQPIPEMLDIEGVGNFEQPKCPKCQSLDVRDSYQDGWTCRACGYQWPDDSKDAEEAPRISCSGMPFETAATFFTPN